MYSVLNEKKHIERWINNKNFKIKCKKCGMIIWRSSLRGHLKGKLHAIRTNQEFNNIKLIVNFD
jgi:hypothetical protein